MSIIRRLMRTDGTSTNLPDDCIGVSLIRAQIHADSVEIVPLRYLELPLHVMVIDRLGYHKHLPVNVEATKYYVEHCARTGKVKIRGDAVIVPASELPEGER